MDMGVLKQFLRDEALSTHSFNITGENSPGKRTKTTNNTATSSTNEIEKTKPLTSHRIIMDVIVR